tara:strand:+ start:13330 stop:13821 length:492 start_codon:yes stop_codon:yes gene_type:complete
VFIKVCEIMAESDSRTGEGTEDSKQNWRRDLENRATTGDEARKENTVLKAQILSLTKDSLFRSAGLNTEDKATQYFVKAYEGELDVDAIRMEAEATGFLGRGKSSQQEDRDYDYSAEERMAAASDGGEPYIPDDFDKQMSSAKSLDDLKEIWESAGHMWNAAT